MPSPSCARCAERKVRCDRANPCNPCVKQNALCVYRQAQPSRKRTKRDTRDEMQQKLKRYESLLSMEEAAKSAESPASGEKTASTPGSKDANCIMDMFNPENIITKSQFMSTRGQISFIDNSLMTRVAEEIDDGKDSLHEDHEDDQNSSILSSGEDFGYLIGTTSKKTFSHPPTTQILELWEVFVENVDPVTKILHVPSTRPTIKKVATNQDRLPPEIEALMFSIYSCAVLSLDDLECEERLGGSRTKLLSRFVAATKNALARANFIQTTSFVVLQALMLHILSIRNTSNPRAVWNMTGLAIRIAETMGMHRDGAVLGLPPFETEIRRRVWTYLKMHDGRTAELCGQAKFRGFDADTYAAVPLANVDDDQLYPGMSVIAEPPQRATDMVFCAAKSEALALAVQFGARLREQKPGVEPTADHFIESNDVDFKSQHIDMFERVLEEKYIKYCDPSQPIQLMAMLFGRCSLTVGRFLARHPRRWQAIQEVPESERLEVWNIALKFLEQFDMAQSSRQLRRFNWQTCYYVNYYAFIHILDTLRIDPLKTDASRAWTAVEATFVNNPDLITNTKRPLHVAIGNLALKAFVAREQALREKSKPSPTVPDFIAELRQQRAVAQARRQARIARMQQDQAPNTANGTSSNLPSKEPEKPASDNVFPTPPASASAPGTSSGKTPQASNMPSENYGNSEPFSFDMPMYNENTAYFDFSQEPLLMDDTIDPMNGVDWDQWDTWLSGADAVQTNFDTTFWQ